MRKILLLIFLAVSLTAYKWTFDERFTTLDNWTITSEQGDIVNGMVIGIDPYGAINIKSLDTLDPIHTVEFRAKVSTRSANANLIFYAHTSDAKRKYTLYFASTGWDGLTAEGIRILADTNYEYHFNKRIFHTYRITCDGSVVKFYIDNSSAIITTAGLQDSSQDDKPKFANDSVSEGMIRTVIDWIRWIDGVVIPPIRQELVMQ